MRVYRYRELKPAGVPFTRKHISHLEKAGQFPSHFNLTPFSVAWVADEVDQWVDEKVRSRRVVSLPTATDEPKAPKPTPPQRRGPGRPKESSHKSKLNASPAAAPVPLAAKAPE